MKPLVCCIALATATFAQSPRDIALGRAFARDIEARTPRFTDPFVDSYLNLLADQLSRRARLDVAVTVHVLEDEQPRAWGLPHGLVLLSTGLILRTQTEAAMAAIIAHEIGHIASPLKPTRAQPATIPIIFLGCTRFRSLPFFLGQRSEDQEMEADRLAMHYATDAGYDPQTVRAVLGAVAPEPAITAQAPYVLNTSQFEQVRSRMPHAEQARRLPPTLYR